MKPQPGEQYTVVKGDTLWDIAGSAYGNPRKWKIIYNTNKGILRDPKIYPNTVVLIYPGEILNIPLDGDKEKLKRELDQENETEKEENLRFIINGKEVNVISGRCTLCLDTLSDGFSFSVDAKNAPKIKPFGYEECEVYLDDIKLIDGVIYNGDTESSAKSEIVNVTGYAKSKDIVDSNPEPPFVFREKTLKQICESLCELYGRTIKDNVNDSYKFKKSKIERQEKISEFLVKLAKQRQVLLRSNSIGEIEITRANTESEPILFIDDESELAEPIKFSYNGEKRFSKYIALGKNPKRNNKGVFKDPNIKRYRVYSDKADESTPDEIKKPADWACRQAQAESVTVSFSVSGFYNDKKEPIRENNIVSIERETLFMIPGTDLLISSVEYEQEKDSKLTKINCVLPEIYTNKKVDENWKTLGQ